MKDLSHIVSGSSKPDLRPGPHVLIVGGGASGVLMAVHLLRASETIRVTVLERRPDFGSGLAFSTSDPCHLLNTRASNMSAFSGEPDHFLCWLRSCESASEPDASSFVSRQVYGRYLGSLLQPWQRPGHSERLHLVQSDCQSVVETASGIVAKLANNATIAADLAILATGHVAPGSGESGLLTDPWNKPPAVDPGAAVLVIGSGLTMVDMAITLIGKGHYGPILALSRRGLLPRTHQPNRAQAMALEDLPMGSGLSGLMRWLCQGATEATTSGGDWRDVVDGFRPHIQAVWRSLSSAERRRFLRHAAPWWEVHRHRMPPASQARIETALAIGQLQIIRGSFSQAQPAADGMIDATYQPPGKGPARTVTIAQILDCRGIRRDLESNAAPVIKDLLMRGCARVDPLRIGLDVSADCQLIDKDGRASRRILAIGPASRSAFWEITAIPDIREQVATLADEIASATTGGGLLPVSLNSD